MAPVNETGKARTFGSGRFVLELDGKQAGFLKSIDGGGVTAEVVREAPGPDHLIRKHLGNVKYEDLVIEADLSLDENFYAWIADSWKGKYQRKDVSVYTLDANNNVKRLDEYYNALITEVTIPAMDAASKEAARMTVKISPEYTRHKKGSGKMGKLPGIGKQKLWTTSNFRLNIGDLDCSRVSRVEPLVVKQSLSRDEVGGQRDYQLEPTSLEFPNLMITLAETSSQTWVDWHEDFVIKGKNGADQEKNGSLVFLAADQKTELAQLSFFNLGIFKLTPDKVEAGGEKIRRLKAEMYCEEIEFKYEGL